VNTARKALERVLKVVQEYLPPDGIDAEESLSRICEIIDPWPLPPDEPEISETAEVWIAWTNTDCTEGRGYQYPLAVCWKEATAVRMGQRGYVQGSDCPVEKSLAIRIGGRWLVPSQVHQPTREDEYAQGRIDARKTALAKAMAAGLTAADLQNLGVKS